MQRRCGDLLEVLHDDTKSAEAFGAATAAIDVAVGGATLDRDLVRTQTFADAVAAAVAAASSAPATSAQPQPSA
jgi:hypothetical protein